MPGYGGSPGSIDADPLYADLFSGDCRLRSGASCIDAARSSLVPADTYDLDVDGDTSEPLPVDLGWMPRIVDVPGTIDTGVGFPCVDMGAYEFQPATSVDEAFADGGWPTRILSAAPNPMRATITVEYSTASEGATLEVFDVQGRLVASLSDAAAITRRCARARCAGLDCAEGRRWAEPWLCCRLSSDIGLR